MICILCSNWYSRGVKVLTPGPFGKCEQHFVFFTTVVENKQSALTICQIVTDCNSPGSFPPTWDTTGVVPGSDTTNTTLAAHFWTRLCVVMTLDGLTPVCSLWSSHKSLIWLWLTMLSRLQSFLLLVHHSFHLCYWSSTNYQTILTHVFRKYAPIECWSI